MLFETSLQEKPCNFWSLCYNHLRIQSFGVVVGSIPTVRLFLVTAILTLMALIAKKLKEANMKKTGEDKMIKVKTVNTRFVTNSCEYSAEFLQCLAAIGTGWTVASVPPTLRKIAWVKTPRSFFVRVMCVYRTTQDNFSDLHIHKKPLKRLRFLFVLFVDMVGVTGSIPVASTTLFKDLAEKPGRFDRKNYYSCNNGGFIWLKPSDFTARRR